PFRFSLLSSVAPRDPLPFPTRRSSDLGGDGERLVERLQLGVERARPLPVPGHGGLVDGAHLRAHHVRGDEDAAATAGLEAAQERSEEHTSELQSRENLVCRLLLEKKKA